MLSLDLHRHIPPGSWVWPSFLTFWCSKSSAADWLMEVLKEKREKNLILKAWDRCRSLGRSSGRKRSLSKDLNRFSKDDSIRKKGQTETAPSGCFCVYVGPQRQRFVVKTEFVNHPLFKMLLDDAEQEYGFKSDGPIWLPCDVDLFYRVLAEMDSEEDLDYMNPGRSRFSKGYSSFALCSPARLLCSSMNGGGGGGGEFGYRILSPSMMLKINQF